MGAIGYLYKRTLINRTKMALKKPVTYLYLALLLLFTRQDGGLVRVQIDSETVMELPLGQDTRIALGEDGHANTLVIRDGTAQVVEADCPDQVCVMQGWLEDDIIPIACLPSGLVIQMENAPDNGVDRAVG